MKGVPHNLIITERKDRENTQKSGPSKMYHLEKTHKKSVLICKVHFRRFVTRQTTHSSSFYRSVAHVQRDMLHRKNMCVFIQS